MKSIWTSMLMLIAASTFGEESIIHDDGTGAQISFCLPVQDTSGGRTVNYTTFRISVVRKDKFLLLSDLAGKTSDDGKFFCGKIIIPSGFVDSAEILLLGGPANSTLGVTKKLKVRDFKKVKRAKSCTDQR